MTEVRGKELGELAAMHCNQIGSALALCHASVVAREPFRNRLGNCGRAYTRHPHLLGVPRLRRAYPVLRWWPRRLRSAAPRPR
jgi:hypothetical protein